MMDTEIDVEQARTPLAPRKPTSYGATSPNTPPEKTKEKEEASKKPGPGSHTFLYSMIRYHSHYGHSVAYRSILRLLVWLSVINFLIQDTEYFEINYWLYFLVFEVVTSCLFLLEYVLKIWTAVERKEYRNYLEYQSLDDARGRVGLVWMMTSESVIDVICWLPFFIEVCHGIPPCSIASLRILRLVRFGKLHEFWWSFRLVGRVLYYNNMILRQAFVVCFIMLLVCSIALYYTRPAHDPHDNFRSILACAYLAILMLTGQGEPNGTMPWDTRIVISVTALFAIAQFAIPASMLTWGFENEAEHNINLKDWKNMNAASQIFDANIDAPHSSSSSDEGDREKEWSGYLEQLLGSEYEDDPDSDGEQDDSGAAVQKVAQTPAERGKLILEMANTSATSLNFHEMKRAKKIFIKLDTNDTGMLEWQQIRAITESDEHAQDLFEQMSSTCAVTGGDVTLREFFVWLGNVKEKYPRHGEGNVLMKLLGHMEEELAKKYAPAKNRWNKAGGSILSQLRAKKAFEGAATPAVAQPKSKQLMELAQNLGKLEDVNGVLREKLAMLEKEIAQAKVAKVAVGG